MSFGLEPTSVEAHLTLFSVDVAHDHLQVTSCLERNRRSLGLKFSLVPEFGEYLLNVSMESLKTVTRRPARTWGVVRYKVRVRIRRLPAVDYEFESNFTNAGNGVARAHDDKGTLRTANADRSLGIVLRGSDYNERGS